MPDNENPRSYIRPVALPIPPHQGLKITARNAKIYTCEVPTRTEVAQQNFERRRHQMSKCGYRSVVYKPYQPVGEVYLNDKKLILSALGQEQTDQDQNQGQEESSSSSGESESEDEESLRQSKDQQPVVSQHTNYKPKVINDIRAQVNKGRKMIHAVRLGFGLYRLVHDEQNRKQAEAEKERKQKEETARNEMKPALTDSEESDNEMDIELKSYMVPAPKSPTHDIDYGKHLDPKQAQPRLTSLHLPASSQRFQQISSSIKTGLASPQTPQPTLQVSSPIPAHAVDLNIDRSSTGQGETDRMRTSEPSSPTPTPRRFLHPPKSAAHSTVSKSSHRSRKMRSQRPYSPVYSNINYNDITDRKNIFRQLCALNWILEGMSQDQQPPVMPPITSCWKLKDLNEDPRTIRKRVEKDKVTDKDWVTFKQNPARFTQRGTRRGTRRISIHPNFIQRFSTTNNAGITSATVAPSVLRVPSEARPRSGTSVAGETMVSSRTEVQTEYAPDQRATQEGSGSEGHVNSSQSGGGATVTFADPKIRAVSAPPGPISDQTGVTPGTSPVTMAGANVNGAQQNGTPGGTEKKAPPKFQRQKSFTVTTVYTPPSNPSKAIQKIRAKTRVAKAFKNTLSEKELEKLASKPEEQQTTSDSRVRAWVQATGAVNTKRFAAAAIAAFGAISLDNRAEKVPIDSKVKFNEVAEEQALILHDNLEVRDRNRLQVLERKLMCLETFSNIYKALDQMRSSSVVPDTETNEEMRQRVTEECKWYKDLLSNLPQEVKDDRYCTLVLNRIATYGSLEGRKISSSQFLKVLSTLRVWEICAPDINTAIEFVREKVVEMSELEFEDWLNAKFPQPPRPVSAPLPKSSGFRY